MERHRVDLFSLVFGLLFAAVGLLLIGGRPAAIDGLPMAWIGPVVAIGLGLMLILAARPERATEPDESPEETSPQEPA
jgi:TRAP-type C4-dicarboxylate transport system permease small subunit